jgi:hypothetical protein
MNSSLPIRLDPFEESLGFDYWLERRRVFYTDSVLRGKCTDRALPEANRGRLENDDSILPHRSPSPTVLGAAPEAKPLIISIICINMSTSLSQSEAGD